MVVPNRQKDLYELQLDLACFNGVHVLGVDDSWLMGKTRQFCSQHSAENGQEYFVMADDDVRWFTRISPHEWKLRPSEKEDIIKMLRMLEGHLLKYSHVGISAREGNNRVPAGHPSDIVRFNTRLLRVYGWRNDIFPTLTHDTDIMEDFDCSLQALRLGEENACLYYWAQDQRGTQDKGGASEDRTREKHDAAARKLAEKHAPFVRLHEKKNKTGALAERLEVVISWKKAAEEGKRWKSSL